MLRLIGKALKERGWNYVTLDGTTVDREKVVTQFQQDEATPLFLISLKAGGVGLNLTSADYVFLYDPWWNDAVEEQAINRAHRIGRDETVIAKRFVTVETIEEKVLVDTILDDEMGVGQLTGEDFLFLLDL
jgi:SNF2 family DNA or RNA helicase